MGRGKADSAAVSVLGLAEQFGLRHFPVVERRRKGSVAPRLLVDGELVYIYLLEDPRDGQIRYVGKSVNPKARLTSHLNGGRFSAKDEWIRELQRDGFEPVMRIIEVTTSEEWAERERFWIAALRVLDDSILLNKSAGGEEGGRQSMTDAEFRELVESLVRPLGYMPGAAEFTKRFGAPLLQLVYKRGGPRMWASLLGLEYRGKEPLCDEELKGLFRELVAGLTVWPGPRYFEDKGSESVYLMLTKRGGPSAWCARLGLLYPADPDPELVERELRKQLGTRERWPSNREFESLGLIWLRSIVRRSGGEDFWARRLEGP